MSDKRHTFVSAEDSSFPPCKCYQYLDRRRNGRYCVMGKSLDIKINDKSEKHHVIVKVGGGWSTLEDYMVRHIPYKFKVNEYKRPVHSNPSEVQQIYLGITSHYKSLDKSKSVYYSIF